MDTETRIRVLRRDSYRCQFPEGYRLCGVPASQVGTPEGQLEEVALCLVHAGGPYENHPSTPGSGLLG